MVEFWGSAVVFCGNDVVFAGAVVVLACVMFRSGLGVVVDGTG